MTTERDRILSRRNRGVSWAEILDLGIADVLPGPKISRRVSATAVRKEAKENPIALAALGGISGGAIESFGRHLQESIDDRINTIINLREWTNLEEFVLIARASGARLVDIAMATGTSIEQIQRSINAATRAPRPPSQWLPN